jgi:hypothetical protein
MKNNLFSDEKEEFFMLERKPRNCAEVYKMYVAQAYWLTDRQGLTPPVFPSFHLP